MLLLSGIIKHTCEGYKGSVLIEPEQAIEKADYKCGKSFYLDPILDTYKKKIIENPIVDKILDMIAKANIDRLDFGLKKITNNHSHVVFTNEDKYQNYKPDPDSKTKIIYSRKLFHYGDMVGLRYYQLSYNISNLSCVLVKVEIFVLICKLHKRLSSLLPFM